MPVSTRYFWKKLGDDELFPAIFSSDFLSIIREEYN